MVIIMNWYKKIAEKPKPVEYTYGGIIFTGKFYGKYRRETSIDPAEFPEFELINAKINKSDLEGLWDYIEWVEDDFIKKVNEEVASRTSHFGYIDEPIEIIYNGIRFIIRVAKDPGDWVIVGADMEDDGRFLDTLPEKLRNRIAEDVSGESLS
jgi:hypothetical protein